MVLLKEYFLKNYVYVSGGTGMCKCVQVHKDARRWCQVPGAGLTGG